MEIRTPQAAQNGSQHLLERSVLSSTPSCRSHPPPLSLSLTERQYVKAREHFLYAEQPQEFGNMLVELAMTFGYSGEADLFIAQAVLQ